MYALALEEGLTGEILEEMKVIRTLFQENPDYVHLLSEPSIPGNERIDLIEAAFGNQAERYLVNFLKLLCERNLLREFGGCCDEYARRYNRDNGIAEATATSAVPMTEAQAEALKQKLEKLSGKKISLSLKTDPSLRRRARGAGGQRAGRNRKRPPRRTFPETGQPDTVIGCSVIQK